MNRDDSIGKWKQFNGKIMEQWCELHDDQTGIVATKRDQVAGYTQAQCGIAQQNPRYNSRHSTAYLLNAAATKRTDS